jgi:hypothetical protein
VDCRSSVKEEAWHRRFIGKKIFATMVSDDVASKRCEFFRCDEQSMS